MPGLAEKPSKWQSLRKAERRDGPGLKAIQFQAVSSRKNLRVQLELVGIQIGF
jgi:hypothetical protein